MPFGVEPDLGGAEAAPGDLLSFIQFMNGATALGGPDADTLIFGSGMSATRGTGATANEVTVTATGGAGGGAETLLLDLDGLTSAAFDGVAFSDWDVVQRVASADAAWSAGAGAIVFTRTGTYKVTIVGKITDDSGSWAVNGETYYGSAVPVATWITRSGHSRKADNESVFISGGSGVIFTDEYFVNVTNIATVTVVPSLHGSNYFDSAQSASMSALVSVTRIGDAQV